MRILVILSVIVTVTTAAITHFSPATHQIYTAAAIPLIPTAQLYHNQDSLGQYSFGYSGGPSVKSEQKTLDGITRGTYSYIDGDGQLQTVQYTADSLNGFRVAATNLPIAPTDDRMSPAPVQDTPEVAQARLDHMNAYREAEIRAAAKDEDDNGDDNDMTNESNSGENNGNDGNDNGNGNDHENNNNENTSPADTTQTTNHVISSVELHELRPVNIPPSSQSFIHVASPVVHGYSSQIYGPTIIRHPLAFSTAYSTAPAAKVLTSGYILTNNGLENFGNFHHNNNAGNNNNNNGGNGGQR